MPELTFPLFSVNINVPGLVNPIVVVPQPDNSVNVTASFMPGELKLSGSPMSFNPLALLTLFEDLAAALPKIIADIQTVFGSVAPAPLPGPGAHNPPPSPKPN